MSDASAALAAIDALMVAIRDATTRAVADGVALVEAAAKTNAPVRTGTLRRSIFSEPPVAVGPAAYAARVGPTVIYGRIRELGGDIYPKRARMLRWYGPGGQPIFARHVHQVGRPYLKPAVESTGEGFRELAARRWADAIRSV